MLCTSFHVCLVISKNQSSCQFYKKNYLCHFAEDVQDVFLDGTFKYCSKYFFQMYTMHGCKNGNYVHLLYCYMHCYREKVKYATNRCQNIPQSVLVVQMITQHFLISHVFSLYSVLNPRSWILCHQFCPRWNLQQSLFVPGNTRIT
jgi:hypothetical protein